MSRTVIATEFKKFAMHQKEGQVEREGVVIEESYMNLVNDSKGLKYYEIDEKATSQYNKEVEEMHKAKKERKELEHTKQSSLIDSFVEVVTKTSKAKKNDSNNIG